VLVLIYFSFIKVSSSSAIFLRDTLRRDYFANRVFDSLDAATTQAEKNLAEMAIKKEAMHRLTN